MPGQHVKPGIGDGGGGFNGGQPAGKHPGKVPFRLDAKLNVNIGKTQISIGHKHPPPLTGEGLGQADRQ